MGVEGVTESTRAQSSLEIRQQFVQSRDRMIEQRYVLLHVKLHHEVPYGKAVYILGNSQQLMNWKPGAQTRLEWTHDHNWRKSLILPRSPHTQYKYAIGSFDQPWNSELEWETGGNRIMNLVKINQDQVHLSQKWNTLRLKLVLLTPMAVQEVSVSGNCPDLGMKVSRLKMSQQKGSGIQNLGDQRVWSLEFDSSKYKKCINYYYFAQIQGALKETREPGKHFYPNNLEDNLLGRIDVQYQLGVITITQSEDFKGFKITRLNQEILIGPYIKTIDDMIVLRQNGVKAVLNLQSLQDMKRYHLDWPLIKHQSQQLGITSFNFQIIDMNFIDFIKKAAQGLKLLCKLIKEFGTVYVHCTAGVFRSPQLVILYLVRFKDYSLNDAIELIKTKRPFIQPYIEGMRNLLSNVYTQFKIKRF